MENVFTSGLTIYLTRSKQKKINFLCAFFWVILQTWTQTPENNPTESIQHSKHGESLKSTKITLLFTTVQIFLKNKFFKSRGRKWFWLRCRMVDGWNR